MLVIDQLRDKTVCEMIMTELCDEDPDLQSALKESKFDPNVVATVFEESIDLADSFGFEGQYNSLINQYDAVDLERIKSLLRRNGAALDKNFKKKRYSSRR